MYRIADYCTIVSSIFFLPYSLLYLCICTIIIVRQGTLVVSCGFVSREVNKNSTRCCDSFYLAQVLTSESYSRGHIPSKIFSRPNRTIPSWTYSKADVCRGTTVLQKYCITNKKLNCLLIHYAGSPLWLTWLMTIMT